MKLFSIHEIIEQAIRTEKLGYEYYTKFAKKFENNEGLNNLFTKLAAMERKHEIIYTNLKEKVQEIEMENWQEVSNYFRAIVESEFFLAKHTSMQYLDYIESVTEAVNFAISFEKETLLYFFGLRDSVKEKSIVEEIIKEEKSHIIWLSKFRAEYTK
jgi:rubrerythrin